nr:hypothetical protein CFP56_45341 [Quercus suber]
MDQNLHFDVADGGGGNAGSSSIQNSKNVVHTWGGDVSEAQMCQAADNGDRWDGLKKGDQALKLGSG